MRYVKLFEEFKSSDHETKSLSDDVKRQHVEMGGVEDEIIWMGDLIAVKRKKNVEIWDNDDYRHNISEPHYTFSIQDLKNMKSAYNTGESVVMLIGMRVVINRNLDVFDCFYDEQDQSKYFYFSESVLDDLIEFLEEEINEKFKSVALPKEELFKKTDKAKGVTLRKDKNGYYVHTHRARSKSYKEVKNIPKSAIEFIESTG